MRGGVPARTNRSVTDMRLSRQSPKPFFVRCTAREPLPMGALKELCLAALKEKGRMTTRQLGDEAGGHDARSSLEALLVEGMVKKIIGPQHRNPKVRPTHYWEAV